MENETRRYVNTLKAALIAPLIIALLSVLGRFLSCLFFSLLSVFNVALYHRYRRARDASHNLAEENAVIILNSALNIVKFVLISESRASPSTAGVQYSARGRRGTRRVRASGDALKNYDCVAKGTVLQALGTGEHGDCGFKLCVFRKWRKPLKLRIISRAPRDRRFYFRRNVNLEISCTLLIQYSPLFLFSGLWSDEQNAQCGMPD